MLCYVCCFSLSQLNKIKKFWWKQVFTISDRNQSAHAMPFTSVHAHVIPCIKCNAERQNYNPLAGCLSAFFVLFSNVLGLTTLKAKRNWKHFEMITDIPSWLYAIQVLKLASIPFLKLLMQFCWHEQYWRPAKSSHLQAKLGCISPGKKWQQQYL